MSLLYYFIIFILGASVGSFINALVYRLQNKKKIVCERSICPQCKHKLAWYDLIPLISFVALRGKCRYCRQSISWQYPLVELITGIVFILPITHYSLPITRYPLPITKQFLVYLVFAIILLIILAYDLRYMLIPDKISLPAIILVTIIQIPYSTFHILNLLLAAFLAAGFFFFQFIVSNGKWIGGGDIRLGFLMGLMLGWPNILLGLFLAYILGTVISLPLIVVGKKKMNSQVPFGVFLSLATIVALLCGDKAIEWYLTFII